MGTLFLIHFAIVYSSFDGFSISTSDPGPVYSCRWTQWMRLLVYKMWTSEADASVRIKINADDIICNCLCALEHTQIDRMRSKRRPHTKSKNVGIIAVSWFVLISSTRDVFHHMIFMFTVLSCIKFQEPMMNRSAIISTIRSLALLSLSQSYGMHTAIVCVCFSCSSKPLTQIHTICSRKYGFNRLDFIGFGWRQKQFIQLEWASKHELINVLFLFFI